MKASKPVLALHSSGIPQAQRLLAAVLLTLSLTAIVTAQAAGDANLELKQKLAALKQSTAANQQKLHKYQWTEIQQVTYKGETKPQQQFMCQYGPDGKIQKFPMGQQQQPSGGRLKQRMIEKKKAEIGDYMGQVKSLLSLYVPPDPQKMQQAIQAGKVSLSRDAAAGLVNLTFKDYAQPGDQMVVAFDPAAKKIAHLNINTYMDQAKDAVTPIVDFSSLPDGTNYAERTVLTAKAKQIVVTTISTNYHLLGAM
jgi:hypothetical protein